MIKFLKEELEVCPNSHKAAEEPTLLGIQAGDFYSLSK